MHFSFFSEAADHRRKDGFIASLHAHGPLQRDGSGVWVVSGYDLAREVLLDPKHFSSDVLRGGFPLLNDDPPRHTQLRALVSKAFSPARIEALRPSIAEIAQSAIENMQARREIDMVEALTTPLPITVIAGLLGIPAADSARFKRWSNAIVGVMDDLSGVGRSQTLSELRAYFMDIVRERRAEPGSDLISALLRADEEGQTLSDAEVIGFTTLLLVAGNETTTNLLSNLLDRMAGEPGELARMRADPSLVEGWIEEVLRLDPPAQFAMRMVREARTLAGQALKAGEYVVVYLAAANRDPARWQDPGSFRPKRERLRHLAFGYGVHSCLGAALARLETQVALQSLCTRFDSIARGSAPKERVRSTLLYGFRKLPVVLF